MPIKQPTKIELLNELAHYMEPTAYQIVTYWDRPILVGLVAYHRARKGLA